jgi:hypothetical protein
MQVSVELHAVPGQVAWVAHTLLALQICPVGQSELKLHVWAVLVVH